MEKYQKIIDKLIEDSFPKLKGKKTKIFEFNITNLYALFLPSNSIGVHKKCRGFSNRAIKGMLVHELCHAEFSNKEGIVKSWLIFIIYWFFPKLRRKEEIKTDKLTIKKGYARQLFEITKIIELELNGEIKYGLSSQEIKFYAKKIKKW